jgi:hypothetical protein
MAQHLDRGQELVEVHVQHPPGHRTVVTEARKSPITRQ